MLANRYGVFMNVSFVIIFVLLASSFVVKVDCPYCGGAGHMQIAEGQSFKDLKVVGIKTTSKFIPRGCNANNLFSVTTNVTLSNEGNVTWNGWVEANLVEAKTGTLVSNKYVRVQMNAGEMRSYSFSVVTDIAGLRSEHGFWDNPDFETSVTPAHGVIPCPPCDATGKITLINWFIAVLRGEGYAPLG